MGSYSGWWPAPWRLHYGMTNSRHPPPFIKTAIRLRHQPAHEHERQPIPLQGCTRSHSWQQFFSCSDFKYALNIPTRSISTYTTNRPTLYLSNFILNNYWDTAFAPSQRNTLPGRIGMIVGHQNVFTRGPWKSACGKWDDTRSLWMWKNRFPGKRFWHDVRDNVIG